MSTSDNDFVKTTVKLTWQRGYYPHVKERIIEHKDSLVYKNILAIVLVNHFPPGNVWNGYSIYSIRTNRFVTKLGSKSQEDMKVLCRYLLKDYYGVFRQDHQFKFLFELNKRYGDTAIQQMEEWLKDLTFKGKAFYPLVIKEVRNSNNEEE